eukprot:14227.XXX_627531_626752_1 [CDS] Oithona nana genome sequencing.
MKIAYLILLFFTTFASGQDQKYVYIKVNKEEVCNTNVAQKRNRVESVKEEDDAKGSSKKEPAAAINWNSQPSFSFTEPGPPSEKPLEGLKGNPNGDKIPLEEFLDKVMKKHD